MTDKKINEIMALVADVWFASDDDQAQVRVNKARAAIESALRAVPAIPEGWRLVPVEPTPKMVDATWNDPIELVGGCESHNTRNKRIYRAMLSASPQAPNHTEHILGMVQAPQPACWCETCDLAQGNPMGRTRMSTCPQCGDKRCQRAKHHDNACSAQPAQPDRTEQTR
jgi:hypothetical protein